MEQAEYDSDDIRLTRKFMMCYCDKSIWWIALSSKKWYILQEIYFNSDTTKEIGIVILVLEEKMSPLPVAPSNELHAVRDFSLFIVFNKLQTPSNDKIFRKEIREAAKSRFPIFNKNKNAKSKAQDIPCITLAFLLVKGFH